MDFFHEKCCNFFNDSFLLDSWICFSILAINRLTVNNSKFVETKGQDRQIAFFNRFFFILLDVLERKNSTCFLWFIAHTLLFLLKSDFIADSFSWVWDFLLTIHKLLWFFTNNFWNALIMLHCNFSCFYFALICLLFLIFWNNSAGFLQGLKHLFFHFNIL